MGTTEIVRAEDLGLNDGEVRRRWPDAVEYTAIDGRPCWREEDLADLATVDRAEDAT